MRRLFLLECTQSARRPTLTIRAPFREHDRTANGEDGTKSNDDGSCCGTATVEVPNCRRNCKSQKHYFDLLATSSLTIPERRREPNQFGISLHIQYAIFVSLPGSASKQF
jgi:hypothetical protein